MDCYESSCEDWDDIFQCFGLSDYANSSIDDFMLEDGRNFCEGLLMTNGDGAELQRMLFGEESGIEGFNCHIITEIETCEADDSAHTSLPPTQLPSESSHVAHQTQTADVCNSSLSNKKRKRGEDRGISRWKYCPACSVAIFTGDPHCTHQHRRECTRTASTRLRIICTCGAVVSATNPSRHFNKKSGTHGEAANPLECPTHLYSVSGRSGVRQYLHTFPLLIHKPSNSVPISTTPPATTTSEEPEEPTETWSRSHHASDVSSLPEHEQIRQQQREISESLRSTLRYCRELDNARRRSTAKISPRTPAGKRTPEYRKRVRQTNILMELVHKKDGVAHGLAFWLIAKGIKGHATTVTEALRIAFEEDPGFRKRVSQLLNLEEPPSCKHQLKTRDVAKLVKVEHLSKSSYIAFGKLLQCKCLPPYREVTKFMQSIPIPSFSSGKEGSAVVNDPSQVLFRNYQNIQKSLHREDWKYLTGEFPLEGKEACNGAWRREVAGRKVVTSIHRLHMDATGTGHRSSTEVLQLADLNNQKLINSPESHDVIGLYPVSVLETSFKRELYDRFAKPMHSKLRELLRPHRYVRESAHKQPTHSALPGVCDVVIPDSLWVTNDSDIEKLIFQVVLLVTLDDPEFRQNIGRCGIRAQYGCPICSCTTEQRDCSHSDCRGSCMKAYEPIPISEMARLGAIAEQASASERICTWLRKQLENGQGKDKDRLKAQYLVEQAELKKHLKEALGLPPESTISIKDGWNRLMELTKGQKYIPSFPDIPIWLQAPCALHCYMCITRTLFWITWDFFAHLSLTEIMLTILSKMRLQYLTVFSHKFLLGKETKGKLTLIGRDCETMGKQMVERLKEVKKKASAHGEIFDNLIQLWELWNRAAYYLWSTELTKAEVENCAAVQTAFGNHVRKNFPANIRTWYMHVLEVHVPQYLLKWEEEGLKWSNGKCWGYAIMSTQAMEHKMQDVKETLDHTVKNSTQLSQGLQSMLRVRSEFFGEQPVRRDVTCGRCGMKGHMATSKKCSKYDINNYPHHLKLLGKHKQVIPTELPGTIEISLPEKSNVWPMSDCVDWCSEAGDEESISDIDRDAVLLSQSSRVQDVSLANLAPASAGCTPDPTPKSTLAPAPEGASDPTSESAPEFIITSSPVPDPTPDSAPLSTNATSAFTNADNKQGDESLEDDSEFERPRKRKRTRSSDATIDYLRKIAQREEVAPDECMPMETESYYSSSESSAVQALTKTYSSSVLIGEVDPVEYLDPSDICTGSQLKERLKRLTVPELQQRLKKHNVDYGKETKPELVDLLKDAIINEYDDYVLSKLQREMEEDREREKVKSAQRKKKAEEKRVELEQMQKERREKEDWDELVASCNSLNSVLINKKTT